MAYPKHVTVNESTGEIEIDFHAIFKAAIENSDGPGPYGHGDLFNSDDEDEQQKIDSAIKKLIKTKEFKTYIDTILLKGANVLDVQTIFALKELAGYLGDPPNETIVADIPTLLQNAKSSF